MTTETHSKAASAFLQDEERSKWHDDTLWFVRAKRDKAANKLPGWEALRDAAAAIKEHTLSRLDEYLEEFEANAIANGVKVHWANDAAEHNSIIYSILQENNAKRVVKSKSMLTEECALNPYLQSKGVEVVDTDLGEFIVQLRDEHPSHIVLPAIHLKKQDVSDTFHQHLHTEKNNKDEVYLTRAARSFLREKYLTADAAITGVNFAIAETGGIVVCTNEGNADFGANANKVHIACMGFEKLIPKLDHLSVFLRLLARSATGQPITTYSSHFRKPKQGQQMHLVIVNNGRANQLSKPAFRNSLKCIRCAACFNTCPVYRRSGGHSYHTSIAGPIGSILAPNMDMRKNADLPFASTLCGSCTNVCPVKINIHEQLYAWRQVLMKEGYGGAAKTAAMKSMSVVLSNPKLYRVSGSVGRSVMRLAPWSVNNKLNPWYKQRDLPEPPKQSFRDWYLKNKTNE
ncbi:lactate utilization protein B [Aridibaculum aurantiacum]|uniref:lactate utilization protein B n=1 Tax=Aridibaculum aurantiacum TaxID=2810307 RepID=UPI001F621F75|nr:lactate utilization protein B [Aridibaculum aurantiacum]